MIFSRILFSLTVFSFALLMGFKAGENFDIVEDLFGNSVDETAMPGVPIPDNDQYNLLIIGADELNKSGAQLESIWLVAHAKDTSKVSLIPVFPSPNDPIQNLILAKAFSLKNGKPGKEFWDAMRNTNLWWNGYILTDILMTIRMIDRMGGIEVQDRLLTGSQAVSSIPPWESDPFIAVNYQMLLLEGICNKISENQKENLKATSEVIFNNLRSITKTGAVFTNLTAQSEIRGKLICTFPTLEQVRIAPMVANP